MINIGACSTQIGFAGDDSPREVYNSDFCLNGGSTHQKSGVPPPFFYPMDDNKNHWDQLERIWKNAVADLPSVPLSRGVFSDSICAPISNRERVLEMFFERLQGLEIIIENCNILSLYASGRTTGIVLDTGYSKSTVAAVYEGYAIVESIDSASIGGKFMCDLMKAHINGNSFCCFIDA